MSKLNPRRIAEGIDQILSALPVRQRRRAYVLVERVGGAAGGVGLVLPLLGVESIPLGIVEVPVASVIAACLLVSAIASRLAKIHART